jgi:hypothetical protein
MTIKMPQTVEKVWKASENTAIEPAKMPVPSYMVP